MQNFEAVTHVKVCITRNQGSFEYNIWQNKAKFSNKTLTLTFNMSSFYHTIYISSFFSYM